MIPVVARIVRRLESEPEEECFSRSVMSFVSRAACL